MNHRVRLLLSVVPAAIALGAASWAAGAIGTVFPPSVYPPSMTAAHNGALGRCPSESGVEAFAPALRAHVRPIVATYGRVDEQTDLKNSDRAWWPQVTKLWKLHRGRNTSTLVRKIEPASKSPYALIVRHSCGSNVLGRSLAVTAIPPPAPYAKPCSACAITVFFLERRGHPLIYYVH